MSNIDTKTSKGLLGKKLGMTQVWDENNKLIPVTVIEITPNVVTQVRTPEVDGYNAVQIAYGQIDPRKVNKPAAGHFDKAGVTPRRPRASLPCKAEPWWLSGLPGPRSAGPSTA